MRAKAPLGRPDVKREFFVDTRNVVIIVLTSPDSNTPCGGCKGDEAEKVKY